MFTFFYEIFLKKKFVKKYIFNWKRKLYIDLCEVQKKKKKRRKPKKNKYKEKAHALSVYRIFKTATTKITISTLAPTTNKKKKRKQQK